MTKVCKTFMRRFDPGPRLQYFDSSQTADREASFPILQSDLMLKSE